MVAEISFGILRSDLNNCTMDTYHLNRDRVAAVAKTTNIRTSSVTHKPQQKSCLYLPFTWLRLRQVHEQFTAQSQTERLTASGTASSQQFTRNHLEQKRLVADTLNSQPAG
jgi:hypothetical protein